MGAFSMLLGVLTGAVCLCGLYSGLDIKYGDRGLLCWSAFSLLVTLLSGGPVYATVAAALIAGGRASGLEPFTVLLVSLLASKILCSYLFHADVDDVQVARRPYEEEIRDVLFRNDPSQLHLVDAELDRYRGREKQLLREYESRYAPAAEPASTPNAGGLARGNSSAADSFAGEGAAGGARKSVVQMAHEEETRRVQATIEASLKRINDRIDRRR